MSGLFATLTPMRRQTFIAAAAAGLGLLAPAVAQAQTPGLHVDPSSPTGKEYAIPLDQARNSANPQAAPSSGAPGAQAGANAPRFGVGVGDSSKHRRSGSRGGAGAGGSGGSGGGTGGSGNAGAGSSSGGSQGGLPGSGHLPPTALSSANPAGGVTTPLLVIGLALAILMSGALGGLLVRRGRASTRPGS